MTRLSVNEAQRLGILDDGRRAKQQTIEQPLKESEIQAAIKQYLQMTGWFVVKIHQTLGSYKGIADLYALKDSRSVWIEVKTAKGVQSEHQKRFDADIKAHGGEYLVARSIEDVEKYLRSGGS